jgi:hypothetical protein
MRILLVALLLSEHALAGVAGNSPAGTTTARTSVTSSVELDEIYRIFRGRPTVDKAKVATHAKTIDPKWNAGGVWLMLYEQKAGDVTIRGGAAGTDDVVQLAVRLAISKYFSDVMIVETERKHDKKNRVDYYAFKLTMKAPSANPKTKFSIKK